jgi:putative membrane protein
MADSSFFRSDAREKVKRTIVEVEGQTAAELVIAVRKASDTYRAVDFAAGFVTSLALLVVILFDEAAFSVELIPVWIILAFAAGAFVTASLWWLKRALIPRKLRGEAVARGAKGAFFDLGVTKTKDRTGVLVYLSLFEHMAFVIADTGVPTKELGDGWLAIVRDLEAKMAKSPDLDQVLAAVKAMGPLLGKVLPRSADDVNELADDLNAG